LRKTGDQPIQNLEGKEVIKEVKIKQDKQGTLEHEFNQKK
jgi:hypothetical protein